MAVNILFFIYLGNFLKVKSVALGTSNFPGEPSISLGKSLVTSDVAPSPKFLEKIG